MTQHNDNARTGQNTQEIILTPANVNPNQFGKLFAMPVDGYVFAQPLYVSNLSIPGRGVHNVVFVATEADSVYAFDADNNTGANAAPLWKANLVDAAHGAQAGETPMKDATTFNCQNIGPLIGVTGTPVIDMASGSLYVEAKSAFGNTFFHRLHVLDIFTGNEKSPGPAVINATVPGTGDGSSGGNLAFDALHQLSRPGLLLANGLVYVGFGSHCEVWPFHGWLFAYDKKSLQQKGVYTPTSNWDGGGLWAGGAGIAADAAGNLYVATGNGKFSQSPPLQLGNSIVKFAASSGAFSVADYFSPFNTDALNAYDIDVGSGGVVLLPDQPGVHPHLLVQSGKEGRIYVVDRDQMTTNNQHYCQGCASDPEIVQESAANQVGGVRGLPAYWNNTTYWWGTDDYLKTIPVVNDTLDFAHLTRSNSFSSYPGATPAISANGNTNGIVWTVNSSSYGATGPPAAPAILLAHDAGNITHELYDSTQAINNRDTAGNAVKFAVPTVANGKVYIGTVSEVDVYGLLNATPQAATPVISPASGTYQNSVTVSITDSMSKASIFYTTDGNTPTTASTRYVKPFVLNSSATVKAIATGTGFLNSKVASASFTIVNPSIIYEPESMPAISSGPLVEKLSYSGFTDGMGVFFNAAKLGDNIAYKLNIAKPGTYDVKVGIKKFTTRGIWQLTVNGRSVGPFRDGYAASEAFAEFDLGNMIVTAAGDAAFKFIAVGRNSASTGYTMAFDYIKLTLR
ncbi:MAG TPA: chitobiase/beta-hexosaminidase C-terminal domain-containing protein [Candidatus Dormibacteraeota bacterium]|nr:chitobiase/beta-hexosaminidase C-terminal domain-containing protein [Candidatus Dormibacteraeota bacterium]